MTHAFPEFRFQGFLLRAASGEDLELATRWTEADVDHVGRVDPAFWLRNDATVNSFLLEDAIGAVFFFRIDRWNIPGEVTRVTIVEGKEHRELRKLKQGCELHIQFPPNDRQGRRLRTMQGMAIGFDWLKKILGQNGYHAVYFTSSNQRLIRFAMQRLGFFEESVTAGVTRLKGYLEADYENESI